MAVDFIPVRDSDFSVFGTRFMTYFTPNVAALGFLPADAAVLAPLASAWTIAASDAAAAQQTADEKITAKKAARHALENKLRSYARQIQARPATTDAQRSALGLTVADGTHTAAVAPSSAPMLKVDTSERFKHTIAFFQTTPDGQGTRAKPKGAKGCAIYRKIGAPPTMVLGAPTDMEFLALDTATPYVVAYGTAEGGKTVYYMAQWMGGPHSDEPGPWSETVEATVVG